MTEALNVHGFPPNGQPDLSVPTGRRRLTARHEAIGQVV